MKWMKERDLLLAQTAAFVQSVTGKRPNIEAQTTVPQAAPQPLLVQPLPVQPQQAQSLLVPAATPALPAATVTPPPPIPIVIEGPPPTASPAPVAAVTVIEVPPPPPQLPQFAKLDLRGDFESEVRDRVANFRAHQQRFLKEREDYCSSTMAKVRAAIRDNTGLPRSGK